METVYLGIVIFLFMLAVFDLLVGVSNDAVNFMNSAVGAKVAKFRTIVIVAAAGVFLGAIMSNGMMDIARHGIFQPSNFSFYEIMCILLAVMVTDVVLLDVFNTLGLPTSTTVSMVFELLGGTFILAILKILGDETGMYSLGDMMNTEKAFSVIMAIFLSVAIAFIAGTVVQYISRLIFSFNYKKNLSWTIGIFGGLSTTALAYFILLQGVQSSPYISPETLEWISSHNSILVLGCFVFFTLLMQILHWCKVNVFRIIVLLGTFSLALAFAGNDLVNFIGVPLAGYSSYMDYVANSNGVGIHDFTMDSLMSSAKTPMIFLFLSGLVMVYALATSKKAQNVIKTSVDLSRQEEGDEMFGSSALARTIVRRATATNEFLVRVIPANVRKWIDSRFNKDEVILANGAAFDMVRAYRYHDEIAPLYHVCDLYRSHGIFTCRPCMGTRKRRLPHHRHVLRHRRMVHHRIRSFHHLCHRHRPDVLHQLRRHVHLHLRSRVPAGTQQHQVQRKAKGGKARRYLQAHDGIQRQERNPHPAPPARA